MNNKSVVHINQIENRITILEKNDFNMSKEGLRLRELPVTAVLSCKTGFRCWKARFVMILVSY